MKHPTKFRLAAIPICFGLIASVLPLVASALSGAIFTTTPDGSIVNENVRYESKFDVYLDGGPKVNAPASAAALPDGNYYFQVTDPSGKDLLSNDHIRCREVKISGGVITEYLGDNRYNYVKSGNSWVSIPCTEYPGKGNKVISVHEFNEDVDHGYIGAMVIQLMPYDDTPNPGGVYKAWITPVDNYDPPYVFLDSAGSANGEQPNQEGYAAGNFHGFIPRYSKTDNYKVKERKPQFGIIALRNYHDANLNCQLDLGEKFIWNWEYGIDDGLGVRNSDSTNDESSGSATTILLKEALGQLDDLWSLDQYRWTEFKDTNLDSQYFTTSGYVHNYLAFSSDNTGPEDPALWDGDLADDYIARFLMEMVCLDNVDDGDGPQSANEFSDFTPSNLGVQALVSDEPQIAITLGEVGFANITVTKTFDSNGDGVKNDGEPSIAYWPLKLTYAPSLLVSNGGPIPDNIIHEGLGGDLHQAIKSRFPSIPNELLVNGTAYRMTDVNGEYEFRLLLPNGYGDAPLTPYPSDFYRVEEASTTGWLPTSAEHVNFDVRSEASGSDGRERPIMGKAYDNDTNNLITDFAFTNICFQEVSFGTKGYWHNKNGLDEMETAFVTGYVNTLAPYDSPTSYFGNGDEPFDGYFTGGVLKIAAAYKNDKVIDGISAGEGTPKAEVSHFLIDGNGGGDPREQLAQQLLAFIFNIEYRLGGDAVIMLPAGGTASTADIVNDAINAWASSDANLQNEMKTLLDTFNNMKVGSGNGVKFIPSNPENCPDIPTSFN